MSIYKFEFVCRAEADECCDELDADNFIVTYSFKMNADECTGEEIRQRFIGFLRACGYSASSFDEVSVYDLVKDKEV